ncbi:MAG: hypothetical protein Q9170_006093 [Blastenia crenularia]
MKPFCLLDLLIAEFLVFQGVVAAPSRSDGGHQLQRRYDRAALATYETAGSHWTTQVTIGTQTLNLLVDTGSADLKAINNLTSHYRWVFSPFIEDPGNHTLYDYTKSPGSQPIIDVPLNGDGPRTNETFDISYGFNNSRVQGIVVSDSVSVNGTPGVWMGVEVATEVSQPWKDMKGIDGILGLGFRDLNFVSPSKVYSFMERLIGATTPTLPVFTVDFDPKRSGGIPSIEVGKIDRRKANGNLQHAPVNNKDGWWAVDDIAFETQGEIFKTNQTMIFDTGGSSVISVGVNVAKEYYNHTLGAHETSEPGVYNFPCSSPLPDFTLHIGNGTAIYRASLLSANTSTSNVCAGVIIGSNGTMGNVGAAFFKGHYVVFDYQEPAIQYAPRL